MFHGFVRGLARLIFALFSHTKVYGKENILHCGNVIYVCNHQSVVDAFISFYVLPSETYFMSKKEVFSNKFYAFFLKRLQMFPINRETVDLKAIKYACDILEEGNALCIFPQGTRHTEPWVRLEDMHAGIGMIALRQKSRVVPMMFKEKPAFFKKNELVIGKEIDLSSFEGKRPNSEEMKRFVQLVTQKMNELLENGSCGF